MKEENQKIAGDKIPQKKFEVIEGGLLTLMNDLNVMENSGWEVNIHITDKNEEYNTFRILYSKRMMRNEW